MSKMRFNSIRWRLIASYVLITILTVSLVGGLTLTLLSQYISSQSKAQLQANAEAIAQQAESLLDPLRLDSLGEMTRTLAFLSSSHILILDADLNVLVDSGTSNQNNSLVWLQSDGSAGSDTPLLISLSPHEVKNKNEEEWMRKALNERHSMSIRVDSGPWGRSVTFEQVQSGDLTANTSPTATASAVSDTAPLKNAVRVPIGSASQPSGYVQVEDPSPSAAAVLAVMRNVLLLAGLGAALIAVIAGSVVSRSLTSPLNLLAESATQMSSGNLAARAPVSGAGEIKQLAAQFNTMAERLQASFQALSAERDALRRFIADASHELRTPITAVSNFIELLQGPAANDPAAREEFLAEAQAQVKRMQWITTHLLDLSRLDAGLVQLELRPVSASDLLESSAAPFQARAAERGVTLELRFPEPDFTITCDQARIEMVLSNLLENALKYTPHGGQVTLSAAQNGSQAQLQVTDNGAGIAPEDLPHIFERFYRGREAQPGSGLGLAIASSLVQLHHGQLLAESSPGQGSTFTTLLPS